MSNIAYIEVGDWSKDGHNQSTRYAIQLTDSLAGENLTKFLSAAEAHFGFVLKNQCREYENNEFPADAFLRLLQGTHAIGMKLHVSDYGDIGYQNDKFLFDNGFDGDEADQPDGLKVDPSAYVGSSVIMEDETFAGCWVALVNYGLYLVDRDERIRIVPEEPGKIYHIGGYGLFFC